MARQCHFVAPEGRRGDRPSEPSTRLRCHADDPPQRVACPFQSAFCLSANYRHCPRLAAAASTSPAPHLRQRVPARQTARELAARAEALPAASLMWRVYARRGLRSYEQQAPAWGVLADQRLDGARRRRVDRRARRQRVWVALRQRLRVSPQEVAALTAIGFTVLAILVVYSVLFELGPIARAIGVGVAAVEAQQRPASESLGAPEALMPDTTEEPTPVPTLSAAIPPAVPYATPTLPSAPTPVPAPPTRLTIGKIALDVPVEPVGYTTIVENGESHLVWDTLPHSASFHDRSAYLGEEGNIVINGHRDLYSSIFRQLNKLQEGDRIEVYAGDVPYTYQVVGVRVLPYVGATVEDIAEHTRLMGPTYESRLTLITCTPVALATHRLYVIAEPVGD